jgi:D-alanine-D-alanine ligase
VALITDATSEAIAPARGTPAAPGGAEDVGAALRELGWEPVVVAFSESGAMWLEELVSGDYRLVFNLCEALAGHVVHEHVAAAAIELLGLPMTGARSFTLGLCLRKDVVGAVLRSHGVAVPEWIVVAAGDPAPRWRAFPAIVKPVADDGSYGIRGDSVVRDRTELAAALRRGHATWDRLLVQRFVPGREFTLAIVGDHVLPHAELDFRAFPPDVPHIVTYAAKWEYGSAEERGLGFRCPAPLSARAARRLTALARRAWAAVEGVGYGRIDVRVDARGTVFVTDVNPNPDLSPRVGLSSQAVVAGWTYVDLIARIVGDALARGASLPAARRGEATRATARDARG